MTDRREIAIAGREKVPGPDRELARSGPQGRAVWERGYAARISNDERTRENRQ